MRTIAAFEKHRGETDATRRIATELGYGYKLVLLEAAGLKGRARKEVALALQRAVTFTSHVLLHSYHEYLPVPNHVWLELTELHLFAHERQMVSNPATSNNESVDMAPSVERHYKAILVTSLTDPYHLVYGDIWRVHAFIAERVRGVSLDPPEALQRHAGVFYIDPALDQRPIPYSLLTKPPGHGLLLNTRALLTGLQRRLDELDAAPDEKVFGSPAEMEARFTNRILVTLGRPPHPTG